MCVCMSLQVYWYTVANTHLPLFIVLFLSAPSPSLLQLLLRWQRGIDQVCQTKGSCWYTVMVDVRVRTCMCVCVCVSVFDPLPAFKRPSSSHQFEISPDSLIRCLHAIVLHI